MTKKNRCQVMNFHFKKSQIHNSTPDSYYPGIVNGIGDYVQGLDYTTATK